MKRFEHLLKRQEPIWEEPNRRPAPASVEDHESRRESLTQVATRTTRTQRPLDASVISATPLSDDEVKYLVDRLQRKYKRQIQAQVKLDPELIGGVRVEIGDEVWDASVRADLEATNQESVCTDDEATRNSSVVGRLETRPSSGPAIPQTGVGANRYMHLGLAIAAPPIPALECYEFLQANLWVRYSQASMKTVLFTGANKSCGVSTAAAHFAASLGQSAGVRVLLMDANVRSPKQSTLAPPASGIGNNDISLKRLLIDAPLLQDPVPGPSNLYVLPSGVRSSMPLSVFQSPRFNELLQKARELFAYVVIDAPSLAEHPETLLLSRKADGVILVVESEKTRKQSALWAKRQIETAGGQLLGVVLNKRKYRIPNWLYKRI